MRTIDELDAEHSLSRWEREAERIGLDCHEAGFWTAGEVWILEGGKRRRQVAPSGFVNLLHRSCHRNLKKLDLAESARVAWSATRLRQLDCGGRPGPSREPQRPFSRSSWSQCAAVRSLPTGVSEALVLGRLPMNDFLIRTRPASSNLVRWLDRLPWVSPVVRCRNTKSAARTEDRTVRIARRAGSWMSRSRTSSSLPSDTGALELVAGRRRE